MTPISIEVATRSRTYPIYIGDGLVGGLQALFDRHRVPPRRFVVSSPLVWKLHGPALEAGIGDCETILIPDGERFKHLQTVSRIYEALIRAEADRHSAVIAVGGGVVGDVAGFAAATYLRGIELVQVPTTLLAQVDSAIGGKVGVNHQLGKNLIGAFHQPLLVAADPLVLKSLPRRELRSGLYEVVKYGMTSSRELFDRLGRETRAIFARDPAVLVPIIEESCRIKGAVVAADERESGARRVLNFGHTAGHALEAVTKYRRFRHGEAIGYGMLVAAEVAVGRGALTETARQALGGMITQLGPLPPIADISTRDMLEAMRHDKKIIGGKLHFVLATAIGASSIVDDVEVGELERALRSIGFRA